MHHNRALTPARAAMVLAAGFGTRLRPLTEELPKPLVPLGDRSVLEHILDRIRASGIEEIVINGHHLAERYDAESLGVRLVVESHIRGTAGGVAGANAILSAGDLLVYNGDILADIDWETLGSRHQKAAPLATLAVTAPLPPGEGTIGVGANQDIVRLRNGRFGEETWSADFVGVQLLSASARPLLPVDGCLVGDVYLPALERGERVVVAPAARSFTDVGTPEAYLEANLHWLAKTGQESFLATSSEVSDSVTLSQSVVGAGAVLGGRGPVDRCIIWPGAHAQAPLSNSVVLNSGRIVPIAG